jgi:hypothetical protein
MAGEVLDYSGSDRRRGQRRFRIGRLEITTRIANPPTENSSRQLRCHILPLADMEATSHIRRLLALGAVWNVNLNDGSGAETLLGHAMG